VEVGKEMASAVGPWIAVVLVILLWLLPTSARAKTTPPARYYRQQLPTTPLSVRPVGSILKREGAAQVPTVQGSKQFKTTIADDPNTFFPVLTKDWGEPQLCVTHPKTNHVQPYYDDETNELVCPKNTTGPTVLKPKASPQQYTGKGRGRSFTPFPRLCCNANADYDFGNHPQRDGAANVRIRKEALKRYGELSPTSKVFG